MTRRDLYVLGLGGALVMGGATALGRVPDRPVPALVAMAVMLAGYVLGIRAVAATPALTIRPSMLVIAVALGSRLVLVVAPPVLEDDVYRYVWDGAVVMDGANPYQFSPQDVMDARLGRPWQGSPGDEEALARLVTLSRDPAIEPSYLRINYPSVPTIYPPVAQAFFGLSSAAAPGSVVAIKLMLVSADLAVGIVLLALLDRLGRPRGWALAYLWSPLVIVSFAGAAHMDAIAMMLVMLAFWAALGRAPVAGGALLGLAVGTKFFAVLAAPALARRLGWRGSVAAAATLLLVYVPFMHEPRLFEGLATYGRLWRMNEAAFTLPAALAGDALARPIAGLAASAIAVVVAWSARSNRAIVAAALAGLTALVLLAPAVNPWYVAWLVPLAALTRCAPVLVLTATILLYYALGVVTDDRPIRALEYVPPLVVLIVSVRSAGRRRSRGAARTCDPCTPRSAARA